MTWDIWLPFKSRMKPVKIRYETINGNKDKINLQNKNTANLSGLKSSEYFFTWVVSIPVDIPVRTIKARAQKNLPKSVDEILLVRRNKTVKLQTAEIRKPEKVIIILLFNNTTYTPKTWVFLLLLY